jgi:hypothetical protein
MALKTGGIIIEGAEQQGKSTFCKKLQERLGIEVIHFGPPQKDFDYFSGYFVDIDKRPGPFLFDRSYVSELAYGQVFNRKNITHDIQNKIENKFNELGYFLVLLELNLPWINRDETVSREQNEKVKLAYKDVFSTIQLDKWTLRPDENSLEFVIKEFNKRK